MGVVAVDMGRPEIPVQLRGDVQVLDLVAIGVPGDLDQADLGLAVLVCAKHDLGAGLGLLMQT